MSFGTLTLSSFDVGCTLLHAHTCTLRSSFSNSNCSLNYTATQDQLFFRHLTTLQSLHTNRIDEISINFHSISSLKGQMVRYTNSVEYYEPMWAFPAGYRRVNVEKIFFLEVCFLCRRLTELLRLSPVLESAQFLSIKQ